jgi:glutathionylspermidine amidase/synthetase
MSEKHGKRSRAAFGTVLGEHEGVQVFSSDYASLAAARGPGASSLVHRWRGHVTGVKYQCVELARRYLLIRNGVLLPSVRNAADIFGLRSVRRLSDGARLRMTAHANGSSGAPPVEGALLVWAPEGAFAGTGHVAVVVAVDLQRGTVDVIEQNVTDAVWPANRHRSRRLRLLRDVCYAVQSPRCTRILGWMTTVPSS